MSELSIFVEDFLDEEPQRSRMGLSLESRPCFGGLGASTIAEGSTVGLWMGSSGSGRYRLTD